jgi:hypothetical protein
MNIIELAKQAGLRRHQEKAPGIDGVVGNWEELEAFAKLVAAQEREECAKLCDEVGKESASHWPHRFSNMIRARSNT